MKAAELQQLIQETVEKTVEKSLEKNNAVLFGQLARYFNTRFEAIQAELDRKIDRMAAAVDALTKRVDTDDQERAAIVSTQNRHADWIGQLADHTNTTLTPERPFT